jgi:hypothetical protein
MALVDQPLLTRELRRIGVLGAAMFVVLIVLSFLLR